MIQKHTPGPWRVEIDKSAAQVKGFPVIEADEYTVVGTEGIYGDVDTDMANARLIAAAPELLSIVERFVALPSAAWHPERHTAEEASLMEQARATIAKATKGDT
jgi:hypothetical protein